MEDLKKRIWIGVSGAGECDTLLYHLAEELGREIARNQAVLVCGGLGGVMEAVAKGAREQGGITIGILPGYEKTGANPYIQVPIPTGFGEARNLILVRCADVLIALAGGAGTLSEIAFALKIGKPVVGLNTFQISGVIPAENPAQAVKKALELAGKK